MSLHITNFWDKQYRKLSSFIRSGRSINFKMVAQKFITPTKSSRRKKFENIISGTSIKSYSLLRYAIVWGELNVIEWFCLNNLLDKAAKFYSPYFLGKAVELSHHDIIDALLENGFLPYLTRKNMLPWGQPLLSPLSRAIVLNEFRATKQLLVYPTRLPPINICFVEDEMDYKHVCRASFQGLGVIVHIETEWCQIKAYIHENNKKRFVGYLNKSFVHNLPVSACLNKKGMACIREILQVILFLYKKGSPWVCTLDRMHSPLHDYQCGSMPENFQNLLWERVFMEKFLGGLLSPHRSHYHPFLLN